MEKSEVVTQLTGLFRTTFNDDKIVLFDEMTAKDVEDWDSLTHAILISEVENHFSIKFKIKEIIKLKNVGVLIEIILSKLN